MRAFVTVTVGCLAAAAGLCFVPGIPTVAGDLPAPEPARAGAAGSPGTSASSFVLHEWGTFTSFAGSNGVPVRFAPNNTDLPSFVYRNQGDPNRKVRILARSAFISMETPVMYFYSGREVEASVRVDFPKGWITEWYPHATVKESDAAGESIQWRVKVLPGNIALFPRDNGNNAYYQARETDAAPLQTLFAAPEDANKDLFRGGAVAQHEKFLFYRGAGVFAPPVTVRALGGGKIRVVNAAGGKATGLLLMSVHGGRVACQSVEDLAAGAETTAMLPEPTTASLDPAQEVQRALISAGLYEREAQAMVNTWKHAWFAEEGTRLLYIVPRARTDELLPLSVKPQPTEIVRVMVGRHDFLTPEQEAGAEELVRRILAARAELNAAEGELQQLGRFSEQARQNAEEQLKAKK
jgi:hypothetical protein